MLAVDFRCVKSISHQTVIFAFRVKRPILKAVKPTGRYIIKRQIFKIIMNENEMSYKRYRPVATADQEVSQHNLERTEKITKKELKSTQLHRK